MHEKFRESWKGAAYIASGLHSDLPDGELEVTLYARGKLESRICSTREVGHVMEELCSKFPMATVYYHDDATMDCLAQIRCHCGHEKSRGCCKEGHHHRAKVTVMRVAVKERADSTP